MDDAPGHYRWSAPTSDRVLEGGHGQARLHPGVDRIADDPTRAGVLERAQVDLALIGAMLGDIHQPLGVEGLGGEVTFEQVITDRRAGSLAVLCPPAHPGRKRPLHGAHTPAAGTAGL